jgi:DNA-binding response OmpR family regulator
VAPTLRPLPVTLDWAHRRLAGPGELTTKLTEAEFAALVTLLEADGASVSRDLLGRVALKRSLGIDDRSVDQLVLKLRRKLALHGGADLSILSSRGLGYVIPDPARFVVNAAAQADDTGDSSQEGE